MKRFCFKAFPWQGRQPLWPQRIDDEEWKVSARRGEMPLGGAENAPAAEKESEKPPADMA